MDAKTLDPNNRDRLVIDAKMIDFRTVRLDSENIGMILLLMKICYGDKAKIAAILWRRLIGLTIGMMMFQRDRLNRPQAVSTIAGAVLDTNWIY